MNVKQVPKELAELLAPYPIISQVPVQWADMDRNHHVNNVVYLRYAEISRLHFFERIDFMDFTGKRPGPILAEVECKYIFPMTYPDQAWLGTRAFDLRETGFWLETLMISEKHKRVSAKVATRVVLFDYENQIKAHMDADLRARILELSGTE